MFIVAEALQVSRPASVGLASRFAVSVEPDPATVTFVPPRMFMLPPVGLSAPPLSPVRVSTSDAPGVEMAQFAAPPATVVRK